jgi:hypothetical protein
MRKKNKKVFDEAGVIVGRLRAGGVTIKGLMREYHCSYNTLTKAIFEVIDREKEWPAIRADQHKRAGAKRKARNAERKFMYGEYNPV